MDRDEPGITHITQLVDGLAEALLTFIGHAPADLREHVFTSVVREMARSRGQVFEEVDRIRQRLQPWPETPQ